MTESSTSARKVTAVERAKTAVRMRMAGAQYADIGVSMGISRQAAWMLVKKSLEATRKETGESADLLRELELQRLDKLYLAMNKQAEQGNQGAVDRCIRIMERRSKLVGLDAPTKQDVTSGGEKIQETKIDDTRYDRAIASLADALRKSVPGTSDKQDG
jgi:hypothetical protein